MGEIIDKISTLSNKNMLDMILNMMNIGISLINIITTMILAGVNLYFVQKNRKRDNYYKAFLDYYFPLKYRLVNLSREVSIFKDSYNLQTLNYYELNFEEKNELIETCLKPYLEFYNSLPKYCIYTNVDSKIIKLNQYYEMLIYISGIEGSVNIKEIQKAYPQCNIDDVVGEIDKMIKKYL